MNSCLFKGIFCCFASICTVSCTILGVDEVKFLLFCCICSCICPSVVLIVEDSGVSDFKSLDSRNTPLFFIFDFSVFSSRFFIFTKNSFKTADCFSSFGFCSIKLDKFLTSLDKFLKSNICLFEVKS